jgi:hypothetical protein
MSKIDDLIQTETEAAELYDDSQPLPKHVKVTRPGHTRSKVFSVRLSEDEMAELEETAKQANLPVRTLARAWILERMRGGSSAVSETGLAHRVETLERQMRRLVHR